MKVTFDNVYNAFQIIAPKGTMISFTGEPTALADGVYLVGDDGIINLDEQFLTDTLYLSTEGTDYAVTGGVRVIYPLGDETLIIRAGSSAIPFSKGGKGGGSGSGTTKYKGTTTTPISNGSTTNPIIIDGESYTAVFGDIAVYNYTEFVFDGTRWGEFGRPFDTIPTSGSANAVTSDGIYQRTPWARGAGNNSACIGQSSTASGANSVSAGFGSQATTEETAAFGYRVLANRPYMFACGKDNVTRSGDLFTVGNGTANTRSNILEANSTSVNINGDIKKNGVSLPTPYTTMPTITAAMLGQIAMYVGETTNDYVKGYFYIASSDGAAEPTYSWVSMVDDVPTSGSKNFISSDGIHAFIPIKNGTGTASAKSDGADNASANYSFAVGRGTVGNRSCLTAVGQYNLSEPGDLFNVGNGSSSSTRSTVFRVNSEGINVNGAITKNGTPVLVNAGTLPSLVYDSENEIFEFNPGTLPSGGVSS